MELILSKDVTRLEVIDTIGGREYVNMYLKKIILSFQDDGRTLKIFVDSQSDTKGIDILC